MSGSHYKVSPEQLDLPDEVDFRSDIYSLGVTAYQAVTGRLPFPDDKAHRCAYAHRFQAPPPIQRAIPESLRDLIMWMLAKDRDRRPASYQELAAVLDTIVRASR